MREMKKNKTKYLRCSSHCFSKSINFNKQHTLALFLDHYKTAIQHYINFLWDNQYSYNNNNNNIFNISKNLLQCPSFIDYKTISFNTKLSARALSSAAIQACAIIKAATEKRCRQLYILNELKKDCEKQPSEKLQRATNRLENKIKQFPIIKPTLPEHIKAELSSKCAEFIECSTHFNGFLKLKCLGDFPNILIPIQYTKVSNKWLKMGKRLGSFLISKDYVNLRYEMPIALKKEGEIIGADQGIKKVLVCSDKQTTKDYGNIHGHTLESIMSRLSRKKKGSKAFARTQELRKNFIHWSINRLNLAKVKQINLEEVVNIRYKSKSSRMMSHWTNTLIRDKLMRFGEEQNVFVKLQSSAFRSQRCSQCGYVHKSNRKGEFFYCLECDFSADTDWNASLNHEENLPDAPIWLRQSKKNREGFYWQPSGFYSCSGQELRVSDVQKKFILL